MNRFQRHVLVVALGAVGIVLGVGVNQLWSADASGGWFMYAPNSDAPFVSSGDRETVVRGAVVWLVLILVWFSVAWRLYRNADQHRD